MMYPFLEKLKIKESLSIAVFLFSFSNLQSQKVGRVDYTRAPNSYIFDIDAAIANDYGGLYIPIGKAFDVLTADNYRDLNTSVVAGKLSASIYWEDVPGLIKSAKIDGSNGRLGRIKVSIDKTKGKGNAVIALKSNNDIVWSWHVWVTDDPQYGVEYYHGIRGTDANGDRFIEQYMDRNLGATSASFLGNDWNNSGGLKYQWGRKDPFPSLIKKDFTFYELNGEVGNVRHHELDIEPGYSNRIVNKIKENDIVKNIEFSIKNPLTPIISISPTEPWYSDNQFLTGATTHNLWADNTNGNNTSSTTVQDKSVYDPCPDGWRVPAFVSQRSNQNSYSPWGYPNTSGFNASQGTINPYSSNTHYPNLKIYPMLGFDFQDNITLPNHVRGMGKFPLNGKYNYYDQNEFYQQDESAEVSIWSATATVQGQARALTMINDVGRTNNNGAGLFSVTSHALSPTGQTLAGVRCMRDPNYLIRSGSHQTYNFNTAFFIERSNNDREALKQPNTILVSPQDDRNVFISTSKAIAVQDFILNKLGYNSSTPLKTKIIWSSNPLLIEKISLQNSSTEYKDLKVQLSPNQYGNAVVAVLDEKSSTLWSWLIWAPKQDPTEQSITYKTELSENTTNVVNLTKSGLPPLTTVFMDRNLGALEAFPVGLSSSPNNSALLELAKESSGLQFQWGRKDPIPSFLKPDGSHYDIFIDPTITETGFVSNYRNLSVVEHQNNFTVNDYSKSVHAENLLKQDKISKVIEKSIQNPLSILVEANQKDWLSPVNSLADDRWGHATEKSIYDPCPEGWRVPDVSFVYAESSPKFNSNNDPLDARGSSPWYFGNTMVNNQQGVPQQLFFNTETVYKGKNILYGAGILGWVFNSSDYYIGGFPSTGARNYKGENNLPSEIINFSGLWTSALAERMKGAPLTMLLKNNTLLTASGKYEDVYPQAALNVRCSRDLPRLIEPEVVGGRGSIVQPQNKSIFLEEAIFDIYPNPFVDVINVISKESMTYNIYDISGKLVLNGTLDNQKIFTNTLQKGLYVLQLVKQNGTKISKKIIK